jgi:hypothetical protein
LDDICWWDYNEKTFINQAINFEQSHHLLSDRLFTFLHIFYYILIYLRKLHIALIQKLKNVVFMINSDDLLFIAHERGIVRVSEKLNIKNSIFQVGFWYYKSWCLLEKLKWIAVWSGKLVVMVQNSSLVICHWYINEMCLSFEFLVSLLFEIFLSKYIYISSFQFFHGKLKRKYICSIFFLTARLV